MNSNKMKSPLWRITLNLLGAQLVASILTLIVMTLTISVFGEDNPVPGQIIAGILGLLLTFLMTYSSAWYVGDRDVNLVKFKHIQENILKGLMAGGLAQILGFVVAVLLLILPASPDGFNPIDFVYRLFYMPFTALFGIPSFINGVLRFIPLLIVPCSAWWGYYNGYHMISMYRKIVYQNKPISKEKDKRLR